MRKVVLLCILPFLLFSCATKKESQYEGNVIIKYITKETHDTVTQNVHDSIFHTIFQKGDTVYETKYIEKTKIVRVVENKCDTLWRDSIRTVKIEKTIEKKYIPKICYFSFAICGLVIIFALVKIKKWLHLI